MQRLGGNHKLLAFALFHYKNVVATDLFSFGSGLGHAFFN